MDNTETLLQAEKFVLEDKKSFLLSYYFIETPCEENEFTGNVASTFSLLVVKTGDEDDVESGFFYDVTRDAARARELLLLLSENTVTPCVMSEILQEIL